MRISHIEPQEKTAQLEQEIARIFNGVMDVVISHDGPQLSLQFRLLELKPMTINYMLSKYWYVEDAKGCYPHSKQKRMVAVNSALGCRHPIKRAKFLQEEDWILVNKTLNRICDQLGVSATIRSSVIKIREGKKSVWLPNYLEKLKDIVEVKGEDYTYSEALVKAIEEASVEDKYKFEAVFLTEPLEVTEKTKITQKVFTDYDELDALAKAHGYDSPTPEQNVNSQKCGWIATMGDSTHSPQGMLKEAMQKLRDVKAQGEDVVMGFCQTGNFSVGYTIYTKGESVTGVSFDDYNNQCSDCDDHDKCHKNGSIDYEKVAKCKEEVETQIQRESKLETQSRREA